MALTLTDAGPSSPGPPFTPASIAGLQVWYEADVGTSTTTDGVAISQWNDQSGNARHATQATGANQPLYKAAILNGKPVVRFDGVNDSLAAAAVSVAQPTTVFIVASSTSVASGFTPFDGNTARQTIFYDSLLHWHYFAGTDQDSGAVNTDTSPHSYSMIFNGASSGFWKDGVSLTTLNPGANALTSLVLGTNSLANGWWPGDIAEFMVYNSSLSTANRQSVESYLRSKYALP